MIPRSQVLAIRGLNYRQREEVAPILVKFLAAGAPAAEILAARGNFQSSTPQLVEGGLVGDHDLTIRILASRLAGYVPKAGHTLQWKDAGAETWQATVRIDRLTAPDASPLWVLRCNKANAKK
jgi:hypothetical protein